ncbi:MAG: hypothetical protein ACREIA_25765 [Opitutaceae bacterium]
MKIIWDSQNREPLYAVNEVALYASVRRKNRRFRRRVFWRDVREVGIGLLAGSGFLVFGSMLAFWDENQLRSLLGSEVEVSRWDALIMLIASALALLFALHHLIGRMRQDRRERQFESSLRGDIDRTLAQTDYQIRVARAIFWWDVIPTGLATVMFTYVIYKIVLTPPAVWLLAAIVIPLGIASDLWCKRRPIRTELLPLKQEFEALRRKLVETERPA